MNIPATRSKEAEPKTPSPRTTGGNSKPNQCFSNIYAKTSACGWRQQKIMDKKVNFKNKKR